ncbi:MAG: L-histidine N(alpha)-methyltransferase [Candidatus Peribacteria bacterium]|nr:L-histidine N(alpha)-methyltransferase [Candidatus Peribacteria bacterium]
MRNIFSTPKFPDASFLYRDHLGQLYENTVHQAAYHPYAEELNLLKYHQTQLQSYLKKSITDVGCGDGAKDVALLGKHPPQGLTCYLADYSAKMLELADENIREQCPGVHMGNHQLLRDGSAYLTQSLEENTYLRLGGTIGNFSDWEILDFFKQMDNNGILQGNQILFSYFSAPSEEEIPLVESWYRTDTAEQRFMAGAEALGLSRDDFEFEVRYIYDSSHFVVENGIKKYPGQIQNGLRAKRDVDIPLDD